MSYYIPGLGPHPARALGCCTSACPLGPALVTPQLRVVVADEVRVDVEVGVGEDAEACAPSSAGRRRKCRGRSHTLYMCTTWSVCVCKILDAYSSINNKIMMIIFLWFFHVIITMLKQHMNLGSISF